MPNAAFTTNPVSLKHLLESCGSGKIQLPDFQRSWVWGEDRIMSLIASISRAFPIGALMTLTCGPQGGAIFARRPIEGSGTEAGAVPPEQLLLDGQQRMTSLYQACLRRSVVRTITPKNKVVKRWFYIDIQKALSSEADRDDAIFSVPEDRIIKANFDRDVVLDLSNAEAEYKNLMFPLNQAMDWDTWQDGFWDYWLQQGNAAKKDLFKRFKNEVLLNFTGYQVPVIALSPDTSNEAVCLVFEKVNTGGKALDAFELLTAMYAAQGHKLRDDWLGTDEGPGMQSRLSSYGRVADQSAGILEKVASTDVLQSIALRYTKKVRMEKAAQGVSENDLPAIRATRQSLLDLPLTGYLEFRDGIEEGFKRAAKFLRSHHIYRVLDIPYQSQLIPLAAILAELGEAAEPAANRAKLSRWFWCGIFGELYGGAAESRFARDIAEVPAWIGGGEEPSTVREGVFRPDRLNTMRTRLSAAYKGIHALLMKQGAKDFRTGQPFETTVFFDEYVDIHHIFPQDWCKKQGIEAKRYDTVINKTPLSYKTNRIIGGNAPSVYLKQLEQGTKRSNQVVDPPISLEELDSYLSSHCASAATLRADDFEAFISNRRVLLLNLIANATGHLIADAAAPEEGDELTEAVARDSGVMEAAE